MRSSFTASSDGHASEWVAGEPVLLNLDVLKSTEERATVACMGIMLFLGTAASSLLVAHPNVATLMRRASGTVIGYRTKGRHRDH